MKAVGLAAVAWGVALGVTALTAAPPPPDPVAPEQMRRVYDEVRTPHKYGVVLRPDPGKMVDSPSVFRAGGRWYMTYIQFDNVGYQTRLARSDDLLAWEPLGTVLTGRNGKWDAKQAAGYVALQDPTWGGSYELEKYAGRHWMTYLGGALAGYETDPLAIGVASTTDPTKVQEWERESDGPVLSRDDTDVRPWEQTTLYKSNVIHDPGKRTGHPFVMFYNGKHGRTERIGIAVSDDMVHWKRLGTDPVIDNGPVGISGDPQVVRLGDLWVMFYFGAFWRPGAFDTFAVSHDLVHWTKWTGPDLVAPSEPWDRLYAHKPWVVRHDGVVYHFYCAVGDQGRAIAVATSKEMRKDR